MATGQMSEVLRHLRKTLVLPDGAGMTDGQLLTCFIERRDEAALAALVKRHGPMVWGVCRRLLGHHQDAEDAFQATFLVLVQKVGAVLPREMVANWLYGVACMTARRVKVANAKRRRRERQVTEMPEPEGVRQDRLHRLQPLLDQELSRLPEKYRVAIVLCDLEGKTRKEAARQLGVPEGTVASRLMRGRALLAKRLARGGLGLSGAALPAVLSHSAASAGVPTSVVSSTIKVACLFAAGQAAAQGLISVKVVALADGVRKAMLLSKLKVATAVLLAVGVLGAGLGAGGFVCRTQAAVAGQAARQNDPQPVRVSEERPDRDKKSKKASAELPEGRKRRLLRWRISFDTKDGNDYAKQLEALGTILAVPTERPGKHRVIRDLSKRPVEARVEDLARMERIFWVESDPRSIRALSKALGLRPVPRLIVVLFPQYIEDELLRKELAFAKRKEGDIEETTFRFFRTRTGFRIKAVSQRAKGDD
jgi:RNA polymerase sigma factor (sigma-70 family)